MGATTNMAQERGWKASMMRPHRLFFHGADFYTWTVPRPLTEIDGQRLMGA